MTCRMVPRSRIKPRPLQWKRQTITTRPLGNSPVSYHSWQIHLISCPILPPHSSPHQSTYTHTPLLKIFDGGRWKFQFLEVTYFSWIMVVVQSLQNTAFLWHLRCASLCYNSAVISFFPYRLWGEGLWGDTIVHFIGLREGIFVSPGISAWGWESEAQWRGEKGKVDKYFGVGPAGNKYRFLGYRWLSIAQTQMYQPASKCFCM